MKSSIRRLTIIASLSVILSALIVGSAQAQTTTTTSPATSVTSTSAALNGSIVTDGQAVSWQFQYGKTTAYGSSTSIVMIPAGQGTVDVSAKVSGLTPNTEYHFRLASQTGSGTYYYPLVINYGQDATFKTNKAGTVTIPTKVVLVKKGAISLPFTCSSKQTCKGKVTLTDKVKVGKKFETLTFASKSFTIKAGKKLTLKPKLSKTALKLLKKARHQSLTVTLTAKFTTGQPKVSKKITIVL